MQALRFVSWCLNLLIGDLRSKWPRSKLCGAGIRKSIGTTTMNACMLDIIFWQTSTFVEDSVAVVYSQ